MVSALGLRIYGIHFRFVSTAIFFIVLMFFLRQAYSKHRHHARMITKGGSKHTTTWHNNIVIVTKHSFNWTILEKDFCTQRFGDVRILIVVQTAVENFEKRQILREMCGDHFYNRYGAVTLFFVGLSEDDAVNMRITEESAAYHDIIQQSFLDSYKSLTWKALAWLRFVDEYCSNARYILKVDDELIFNMHGLVEYLRVNLESPFGIDDENLIICGLADEIYLSPSRDRFSRWFVTKEEYQLNYYHPYCFGLQYIVSQRTAAKLLNASVGEKYFWIDDYFITGHLGDKINATYHNITELHGTKEQLLDGTVVFWFGHNTNMSDVRVTWKKVNAMGWWNISRKFTPNIYMS